MQAFNRADEPAFADCLDPHIVLWVEGDLRVAMGDRVITSRATALCQKESGKWRIVHQAHSTVLAETPQAAKTR